MGIPGFETEEVVQDFNKAIREGKKNDKIAEAERQAQGVTTTSLPEQQACLRAAQRECVKRLQTYLRGRVMRRTI